MVETKKVDKGFIVGNLSNVNIQEFYKNVKEYIEELNYDFREKEQAQEKNQYGGVVSFKFEGSKKLNSFGKKVMKTDMRFSNIKGNKADVKISFEFNAELDYKNKWDKNNVQRFLYKLYINYLGKDQIKKSIIDIIVDDCAKFRKFLKSQLKFYNK